MTWTTMQPRKHDSDVFSLSLRNGTMQLYLGAAVQIALGSASKGSRVTVDLGFGEHLGLLRLTKVPKEENRGYTVHQHRNAKAAYMRFKPWRINGPDHDSTRMPWVASAEGIVEAKLPQWALPGTPAPRRAALAWH